MVITEVESVVEVEREKRIGTIIKNKEKLELRLCVGIPMTGTLRSEWVLARYGQVTPCNWSVVEQVQWLDQYSPLGYTVADARNIIATNAVNMDFEWLFFIDHDTMLPPKTLVKLNKYMIDKKYPVVSGLYFVKAVPSEPIIYRGRGTGYYADWKFGDLVEVDGVPLGCTLIHVSILKALYYESPEYMIGALKVRRMFDSPAEMNYDPELQAWKTKVGTEDLEWCTKVITKRIFDKAGWSEFQEKEFPFVIDTSIFCEHIDFSGVKYPANGEHIDYMTEKQKDSFVKTGQLIID